MDPTPCPTCEVTVTNRDRFLTPAQRAAKSRLRKAANNLAKALRLGRGPDGYAPTDDYADCPSCSGPGLRMFARTSEEGGRLCVRCVVVELDKRGKVIRA